MPIGTVKSYSEQKGYGFIAPETGGQDIFVHVSALARAGLETLTVGQRLKYELVEDRRGRMSAGNLHPA